MFEQIFKKFYKNTYYSTHQTEIRSRIPIFVDRMIFAPHKYSDLLEMFIACFNTGISSGNSKSEVHMSGLLLSFIAFFRMSNNREELITYLNNILDMLILDDKYGLCEAGTQVQEFIE